MHPSTCSNGIRVLYYPVRNDQTGEHGEAKNEDVSRWIHVCVLKMWGETTTLEKIVSPVYWNINVTVWIMFAKMLCTCRLDTPAAEMTPNITMNMPPITGVGIVVNIAPTLPNTPMTTIKTPLAIITMRLPTFEEKTCVSQYTLREKSGFNYHQSVRLCNSSHLCNTKRSDVLAVWGGAVSCTPGSSQQTAQSLNANPSVDGMFRGRWSPG